MNYNFDNIINRKGTNSIKYDFALEMNKPEGLLPMWVADMDFSTAPEILEDLQKTVKHGIFGYSEPKEDYYNAVINWFNTRYDYLVQPNEIIRSPGLVNGITQAVCALTKPNDAVIIQTPVYYPFYDIINNNNRTLVCNSLRYEDGKYTIDFTDFEQKIVENKVKMFILCSPHNPVGRVWTRFELEEMNRICVNHNVIVVSDEIHCDLVWNSHKHYCFGLLNDNAIIATSPSKTFNLAGLKVSNLIVKNEEIRHKLNEEITRGGAGRINTLGIIACKSAYTKGDAWLEALKLYLHDNIQLVQTFLESRIPQIKLIDPQAMYLLWLDFSEYQLSQDELEKKIIEEAKLWLNNGTIFGKEGNGFQRINIACPRKTVVNALERLGKTFCN